MRFEAEFSLYLLFFIIFPYFLKFSSVLVNIQIRLSAYQNIPSDDSNISKLKFASKFNNVGCVAEEIRVIL